MQNTINVKQIGLNYNTRPTVNSRNQLQTQ